MEVLILCALRQGLRQGLRMILTGSIDSIMSFIASSAVSYATCH